MRHFFAPFIWLDRVAQKAVDASVFFLMRRFGTPKSYIIYALFNLVAFCLILWAAINTAKKEYIVVFVSCITGFWCLYNGKYERNRIEQYEKNGKDDRVRFSQEFRIFYKIVSFGLFFLMVAIYFVYTPTMEMSLGVISMSAFLVVSYVQNTPNLPPPQKQTVSDLVHDSA